LVVEEGMITFRGDLAQAQRTHPQAPVTRMGGMIIPGMVDTHVHYPQLPIIGGLGMPLLQWLDECALPQEERLADSHHARDVAKAFIAGLMRAGTTSALVFGSHFASAMREFFDVAAGSGLRLTSGVVVSDRSLPESLLTTPAQAKADMEELIATYHNDGRLRYAVTPRFSLSASEAILDVCQEVFEQHPGVLFTSHVNENPEEVDVVRNLFPRHSSYTHTYEAFGLVTNRSVLAHNVHPIDTELTQLALNGASIAHCPTSNSSLGSGLFPMTAHLEAGVHVALGCDVGAGTGLSLFKEGLQAYFQQQLHPQGYPLTPTHLLYLATRAGALALGLDHVGYLDVGMAFDALNIVPQHASTFDYVWAGASSPHEALAALFTLGTDADITGVYVNGDSVSPHANHSGKVHSALTLP